MHVWRYHVASITLGFIPGWFVVSCGASWGSGVWTWSTVIIERYLLTCACLLVLRYICLCCQELDGERSQKPTRFQNKPNWSTAASRSWLLGNIIFLCSIDYSLFFLQLCVLFLYILMTLLNQQFSPLRNVEETPYTKVHWTHNHMHGPNWLPNPNWAYTCVCALVQDHSSENHRQCKKAVPFRAKHFSCSAYESTSALVPIPKAPNSMR